jgi:hypothetical protein
MEIGEPKSISVNIFMFSMACDLHLDRIQNSRINLIPNRNKISVWGKSEFNIRIWK